MPHSKHVAFATAFRFSSRSILHSKSSSSLQIAAGALVAVFQAKDLVAESAGNDKAVNMLQIH